MVLLVSMNSNRWKAATPSGFLAELQEYQVQVTPIVCTD